METNLHTHHRQRMRDKYLKDGAEVFKTHELLEMLLFNSIPRNDTNSTAHRLLNVSEESGCDLLWAGYDILRRAEGVGDKSALLVRLSIDTTLRLLADCLGEAPLDDEFAKRTYLYIKLAARRERCAVVVLLNRRGCVIDCVDLARGPVWRCDDFVVAAMEIVRSVGASSFIVCHNHKNGDEEPSVEDYFITTGFNAAAKAEGIGFEGHYIVTSHRCIKVEL